MNDQIGGIYTSFGYGVLPRSVMRDTSLPAQSKAIYAYLISFAGSNRTAWPSVSLMAYELGMGRDTFYKYMNVLKETGYIQVERQREVGRWVNNVYKINDSPCPDLPDTVKPDKEKPYKEKPDTVNQDTNNNIPTSNSSNNNSSNADFENADAMQAQCERIANAKQQQSGATDDLSFVKQVIDYLNEKTGSRYRPNTAKTRSFILARQKEGYKLEDFISVIDKKTTEWKGTDMEKYLRPETLFSPSKFENYLNQPAKQRMKTGGKRPAGFEERQYADDFFDQFYEEI